MKLAARRSAPSAGYADRPSRSGGNPIVSGAWGDDPSRPTVTVYNHLDVQPASKETEPWETEPFVFTKKGDRYFGRGHDGRQGPRALGALRREGRHGRGRARERARPLGVRGGDRLAELREGRRGRPGRARDRLGHRLRHDLDRARQAGGAGGPPRPAGHALHARDGHDRPALGRHGRRGAQPDRRAHAARRRVLRREDGRA